MRIPIGYKFILGFVVVVAAVAFAPSGVQLLGYSPESTKILTFAVALTIGLIQNLQQEHYPIERIR